MQEIINRPSLSDSGKGARKRAARSKPVREPWTQKEGTPAVIAPGLFALRLRVIPNVLPYFDKVVADLYPAYCRFCELMNVQPVDVSDEYAIINMHEHLEQLLGETRMVDIYEDVEENGKFWFVYLTPLGCSDNYGTVFYRPIMKQLYGSDGEPYRVLFLKCLQSLKSIQVNDWDDFYETIYDWMEERADDLGDEEEAIVDAHREDLNDMQTVYQEGEGRDAMAAIRTSEPLTEADLDFDKNGLDPEHPLCKYAVELLEIIKLDRCLTDFAEEPDDDSTYYLAFPEQFCIYYDMDDLFFEHEEHINSLAQEGIQVPRSVTTITDVMETIPMHDDPFPALVSQFFDKYCSLEDDIKKYNEKGGEPCKK